MLETWKVVQDDEWLHKKSKSNYRWWQLTHFWKFHPEITLRIFFPILTCAAYFFKWLGKKPPTKEVSLRMIWVNFSNLPASSVRDLGMGGLLFFPVTFSGVYMGVSENSGTPQIIHFNRVFHYFHHPFWGTPIFGNTHISESWPPFSNHQKVAPELISKLCGKLWCRNFVWKKREKRWEKQQQKKCLGVCNNIFLKFARWWFQIFLCSTLLGDIIQFDQFD